MRSLALFMLLVLAFSVIGCATPAEKNAVHLTRVTLAEVVDFEASVRELQRTTAQDYAEAYEALENHLLKNLIYVNSARTNRAVGVLADQAVDRPIRDSDFAALVTTILSQEAEETAATAAMLSELQGERERFEKQAAAQEQFLKAARTKLERLQVPPGFNDRISLLKRVYEAASSAYEEIKKQEKKQGEKESTTQRGSPNPSN